MFLALSGSLLLFCGCQNTVNTVENQDKEATLSAVDTKKFSSDSFCRDRLKVMSVSEAITQGGVKKIQFAVRSERYGFWAEIWSYLRGANPYYIEYKVDWFDTNGMRMNGSNSVWLQEIFIPGETKFLQSVAPNDKCSDFAVSFKESEHGYFQ